MWRDAWLLFRVCLLVVRLWMALFTHFEQLVIPSTAAPLSAFKHNTEEQTKLAFIDLFKLLKAIAYDTPAPSSHYATVENWLSNIYSQIGTGILQPLSTIFRAWAWSQLWILQQTCFSWLYISIPLLEYKLACYAYKPAKFMDTSRCTQGLGAGGALDALCLYCWSEIANDQPFTKHDQCQTYYHTPCIEAWIRQGAETFASCPKCRGSLASEDSNIVVVDSKLSEIFAISKLRLLTKRCGLICLIGIICWAVAITRPNNHNPLHETPAVRIAGALALHNSIWLTTTFACIGLWLSISHQKQFTGNYEPNGLEMLPLMLQPLIIALITQSFAPWLLLKITAYSMVHCSMLWMASGAVVTIPQPQNDSKWKKGVRKTLKFVVRTFVVWAW